MINPREEAKEIDPEVLRRNAEKAVFELRQILVIAMRQDLLTEILSTRLNELTSAIAMAIEIGFPARVEENTSACLPF
jgi:hypothetical protein